MIKDEIELGVLMSEVHRYLLKNASPSSLPPCLSLTRTPTEKTVSRRTSLIAYSGYFKETDWREDSNSLQPTYITSVVRCRKMTVRGLRKTVQCGLKTVGFGVQDLLHAKAALLPTHCVTLDKPLHLSEPQ